MMHKEKRVVPGGRQVFSTIHLEPVVEFLMTRGHLPIHDPEDLGFLISTGGAVCQLTNRITPEDWEAINDEFQLPGNVKYWDGVIRDALNRVDIVGFDQPGSTGDPGGS
jgi:hypothetical protein